VTVTSVLLAMLAAAVVGLLAALLTTRQQRAHLQHAIDTLVTVAGERLDARSATGAAVLDGKKELIDAELRRMGATLEQVTALVQQLESERREQLGQVREQLHGVSRTHADLARTAGALREALTSSQARGQWGERMAEDVLTAAGFKHGINYLTQQTLPSGGRPDVTFLLPGDLCLHMDVKFPLTNYLAMLQADGDADREATRKAFLRDVRARVRELATRGYVDPGAGTLDCVLLFLPNEHVYGYVHEQDPTLLDDALRQGVVLCAPSTLFAVLAVIRQSCDSVALQRTSDEIVALLSGFVTQWERYTDEFERLGRQLDTVRRTYDGLGSTRRNQLERQLARVEEVREQRGITPQVVEERPRLLRLPDIGDSGAVTAEGQQEGGGQVTASAG
jgi:DNA recombination protein RmuC